MISEQFGAARRIEIVSAIASVRDYDPEALAIMIGYRGVLYLGSHKGARNYAAQRAGAVELVTISDGVSTWERVLDRFNGLHSWKLING